MARTIATNQQVDRTDLLNFVRPRHRMILLTRAESANVRRSRTASVLVLSDDFAGAWVQVTAPPQCSVVRR